MNVERWNTDTDGPLSLDAMRRKLEARGYSVSRYVYPPGTYFPDHSHGVDKIETATAPIQISGRTSEASRASFSARGPRLADGIEARGTVQGRTDGAFDPIGDGVLAGRFRMTMGGRSVVLKAGDCLAVPRGVVHSAEMVGSEPAVSLDAVRTV
jgi:quercetin dioxygenase-like cupin family protein